VCCLYDAVSVVVQVLKEFGFGVDHPDVNNGFSEAYLLLKAHEENLRRFEDSIVESGEHQAQAEQSSKEGGVLVEEGRLGSTAGVVALGTVVQAAESRQAELDAAKFSEILIRLDVSSLNPLLLDFLLWKHLLAFSVPSPSNHFMYSSFAMWVVLSLEDCLV
jgi:hypothetical protein